MIADLLHAIGVSSMCAAVVLYVFGMPFFIFGAFIEIENLKKRIKALEEEDDA